LIRRTSINSISEIHKEKEMADFRRWFYALAVVALLAGFTLPVCAQVAPFQCTQASGVPPIVRFEGYTELVGDIILNCTGGVPTPAGQAVPPVNFTVALNTDITSRLLAANLYNEALLIVDEPHSAVLPGRPILNCGASGAPDTGASGPGVCSIISDGNPADTYNGVANAYGTGTCSGTASTTIPPSSGTYGCGRPNVFQGRTGTQQNVNQFNTVSFLGVPIDPPGSTTNRTIRITNIRADANYVQVSTSFSLNEIIAQISVNGNTSLSIPNPTQVVAYVENGLVSKVGNTNFTFLQCNTENGLAFSTGSQGSAPINQTLLYPLGSSPGGKGVPSFSFQEGFASSWKTKNISFVTNQAPGNGVIQPGNSYWTYNQKTTNYPLDYNQNVPGAIYNTESGFEYPSNITGVGDPSPNPPNGVGTVPVTATSAALSSVYNTTALGANGTNITGAGIANQGTRLSMQLTSIPAGSIALVPTEVLLTNSATVPGVGPYSGVMVLTTTDANGAGAFSPYSGAAVGTSSLVAVQSSGLIVYEVLFADPFSIETATIPVEVAYSSNLAQNLPAPGTTAQVAGGFAPFYTRGASPAPQNPSASLPIPRFVPSTTTSNFYSITKCACDILFPYVVSAAGYDTGIAIANTSFDPGATFGFHATPQQGGVQFWYYGTGANNGAPPGTQCTNTTTPGTCPSPATGTGNVVPAGQVLTYVASTGSSQWGLDGRAAGFVGYVIAQAQFQYCHAFAFIGALGAGPTSQQISEGYLGLILDPGGLSRTSQTSENLVH
jgi:hypothetical protein